VIAKPKPPATFSARAATRKDAAPVAELMVASEEAYLEEPDEVDASEVLGWWSGRRNLGRDTIVLTDAEGRIAAHGMLKEEGGHVLELDAYVHPERTGLGLGGFLLDWAEDETRSRRRPTLRTAALARDPAARPLIEGRGFAPVRQFYRMLIELDGPPPGPEWPDGFTCEPFKPGDEAVLHAVCEEAFAEHWGHVPASLEHWQTMVFGRDWWDPSLVYLVREGDEVTAAEVNAVRFGMGWVGTLGVRKPWRGRGLGRALLLLAFGELYRRGQPRIGLGVDAANETGATHLFVSVGMRVAWEADVYEKRVQVP
jgi:mycothiol synthase